MTALVARIGDQFNGTGGYGVLSCSDVGEGELVRGAVVGAEVQAGLLPAVEGPIEVLLGAFVLYFFICFAGAQFARWLEVRNQLKRA